MLIHTNHANNIPQQPQGAGSGKVGIGKPVAADATTGSAGSNNSSNPDTSTATITANDFLQLLVTELQNQDPTADTDPNEYVDQLVQVNSLQQLIQIDTNTTSPSSSGSGSGGSSSAASPDAAGSVLGSSDAVHTPGSRAMVNTGQAAGSRTLQHSGIGMGNLSPNLTQSPQFAAAANNVASALSPSSQKHSKNRAAPSIQSLGFPPR